MHSYHVLITMADGSQGRHCDLYHDGAAAAERAMALFPDARKIDVLRLSTVLLRLPDVRYRPAPAIGRAA